MRWILAAAYATCRAHALNMLWVLERGERIDPRQDDAIVAAEITHYRRERPTEIPVTDAIRKARHTGPIPEDDGGEVPVPLLSEVDAIAY